MSWARYQARWRGTEHVASPELRTDGMWLRLLSPVALEGFAEVADGRWVRAVPATECAQVTYVTTVGEWGGAPVIVLRDRQGELLIEYAGGLVPVAERLGLERVERGVYRRWVPRDEVADLREEATPIAPA
ncbi:hypothetical protein ACFOY2_25220 [Nonomuraea purpurea]|uniref:Uncharacterized protein n=1 Tax=Nonomuraea purpurea TaxID=1849276 RepID=A0ABV8GD20_9ACTN